MGIEIDIMQYSKWYIDAFKKAKKEGIDPNLPKDTIDEYTNWIRKEENEKVFSKLGSSYEKTQLMALNPICYEYRWAARFRKNIEAKISKVLEDRLTQNRFFAHKEFMFPYLNSRVDIYATKGNKKYVFEVKTKLDSRGVGQAGWYSHFIKEHFPDMKVFLATPCYDYVGTWKQDFRQFLIKMNKEFGMGYSPISKTGIFMLINNIENLRWYEVCRKCNNCQGFNLNGKKIPKNEVTNLDKRLQEFGYIL